MKYPIILSLALNLTIGLVAQESINSSGGEAIGPGHSSYSIGQLSYIAVSSENDDAYLFQGVQIPFEIYGLSCSDPYLRIGYDRDRLWHCQCPCQCHLVKPPNGRLIVK